MCTEVRSASVKRLLGRARRVRVMSLKATDRSPSADEAKRGIILRGASAYFKCLFWCVNHIGIRYADSGLSQTFYFYKHIVARRGMLVVIRQLFLMRTRRVCGNVAEADTIAVFFVL